MSNYFLSLVITIKKREREKMEVKLNLLFQSHMKNEKFHLELLQNASLHPK